MDQYHRIEKVIQYLQNHYTEQPDLGQLADVCGLSPHHFHRLFQQWAGVTAKDFLRCLTHSHTRALLLQGTSVLDAAISAGLSSPSRLHELCIHIEAASPGEIKSAGHGIDIHFGVAPSPFGDCLIAQTQRGLCHIGFVDHSSIDQAIDELRSHWPAARFHSDDSLATSLSSQIFTLSPGSGLKAFVKGTQFQVQVWKALLHIPPGMLASYQGIARLIERPAASRAVGGAIGRNPLAYLIPCHRVIRQSGAITGYHWGDERKQAIIAWESVQT